MGPTIPETHPGHAHLADSQCPTPYKRLDIVNPKRLLLQLTSLEDFNKSRLHQAFNGERLSPGTR